jgi:ABC-type lipoprotein release transport system permease subunit
MLAVVALGVFVAATLLAAAPIYARAMADLGLTFKIRDELAGRPGTSVEFPSVALNTTEGRGLQEAVQQRIDQRLGWFTASQSRYIEMGRFLIAKPGDATAPGLVQAAPQSLEGYEGHVRIVAGKLPAATGAGEPMQVAISGASSTASKLAVGDTFELRESFDTCERTLPPSDPPPPGWPPPCNATASAGYALPAVVTAIIEPLDTSDPFWAKPASQYFAPYRLGIPGDGPIVPAFTDEHSIIDGFAANFPAYHAAMAWQIAADPAKLNRANYKAARDDIKALYGEFAPLGGSSYGELADTLDRFGQSADYQEIPLTVLLLEITGIALFYVGLVSAVVVERQAAEIGLLRGRGASTFQVITIYLWQGLVIGIPAILLAPFLAAAATAALGLTPTFDAVSNGSLLPVTIPPIAFAASALGVALSMLALVLPALFVSRRAGATQRRQESRPGRSLIHRYYLDLVLAAVAALVLFEIHQRGTVFEPSETGGLSSDPLLLAAPALLMAAAAALLLRFYPLLLRGIAAVLTRAAGASVELGLTQVVRNSAQYTRLTLLLMMAVAVGSFAASYAATTNRSYDDRAAFETGAQLNAVMPTGNTLPGPAKETDARMSAIDGVDQATGVTRAKGGLATPGNLSQDFQVLGVDPAAMTKMLWWRDDLSNEPFDELMGRLAAADVAPGKPLAGTPVTLSAWVKGDNTLSAVTVWARYRDSRGHFATIELGKADTGGQWKQFTQQVATGVHADLQAPLTLVSIEMTEPSSRFNTNYSPLLIDDITTTDADGKTTTVEDFEGAMRWQTFQARATSQDTLTATKDAPHGGNASAAFTFRAGVSNDFRGFFTTPQALPLSAVASDAFLAASGLKVGGTTMLAVGPSTLVPVTIVGRYSIFPTAPSEDGPSIVFNRDQLTTWVQTSAFSDPPAVVPSQALFTLEKGADEVAIEKVLRAPEIGLVTFASEAHELDTNRRNPLIAAGGSGILLISFVAVLLLVAAALLVSLLTSINRRRVEFAVVRSLGVSRAQIFRMLLLEYSVVAIAGTLAGAVLGLIVGRQMLSFLNVTETGVKVEPAFVLQTEWALVAGAVGAVLVIFGVALVFATRLVSAIAGAQALRTE